MEEFVLSYLTYLIVGTECIHQWVLSKGNLRVSYRMAIGVYIGYIIVETTLALRNPEQLHILVFNTVNVWGIVMAIKGLLRLKREERGEWPSLIYTDQECKDALHRGEYVHAIVPSGDEVLYRCKTHPHIPQVRYVASWADDEWHESFRLANSMASTADEVLGILTEAEALLMLSGDL